jgi:predicted nucleotidyltransferase
LSLLEWKKHVRVGTTHRRAATNADAAAYEAVATSLVEALGATPCVCAVIVCGSLAKGDLVPGWSDLDLIVATDAERSNTDILRLLAYAVGLTNNIAQVPIGLDIVYLSEFRMTRRIGGRPLMMTFEVAHYGETRYGINFLRDQPYTASAREAVEAEREPLIAAEIHNWRRGYVARSADRLAKSRDWLFECAKAVLRLMQCETGPNLITPLSYEAVLDRFRDMRPTSDVIPAFEAAINVRRRWLEFPDAEIPDVLTLFESSLNAYPIRPGVLIR